jgi:outer membrane protein assembly factor BamD
MGTYEHAEFFSSRGKHHEAVDAFDSFIRRNPTDSLAAKAQYLKALSYMEIKEYPLAAVELRILRKDYPNSHLIEDAFYQEGVAYVKQVGRIQRDVSGAYEARSHFRGLLEQYPQTKYAPQIKEHLQHISDMIVRKRLGAADVYRHLGRFDAAGLVLESALTEESESRLLDKVLIMRAEVALKAGQLEAAERAYRRLLEEYPESDHAASAQAGLDKLTSADES